MLLMYTAANSLRLYVEVEADRKEWTHPRQAEQAKAKSFNAMASNSLGFAGRRE